MKLKFFGQSCFAITGDDKATIVDPFFTGNSFVPSPPQGLRPDPILVTHGHSDHIGDVLEMAKRTGATILAVLRAGRILQEATSAIVKAKIKPSVIVLEDLAMSNMVKNHCLTRAISDVGLTEFRRMIEYKAAWNGARVVIAPRFFPSSKTCHVCGCVNDSLTLADREWDCDCGAQLDRDYNAALNLKLLAYR